MAQKMAQKSEHDLSGWMDIAMEEAVAAGERGEIPVGAVVSKGNRLIARTGNRTRELNDPTAHAEMLAIREACLALESERLAGCDLTVTLEPCAMCAGAISFARIERLYFAAADEKGGAVENGTRFFSSAICHHRPEVYSGIQESRANALLTEFFRQLRK